MMLDLETMLHLSFFVVAFAAMYLGLLSDSL